MAALDNTGPGRPTKYKPELCDTVNKLAKLGATDAEMAQILSISESTLNLWKLEYPDFSESINAGKAIADSNVADRLYQRAMGFEHDSEEIKIVSDGSGNGSSIERVPIRKIYPPDTTAAIFWLKNRQKDKWRDRNETELTGKDGSDLISPVININVVQPRLPGNESEINLEDKGG